MRVGACVLEPAGELSGCGWWVAWWLVRDLGRGYLRVIWVGYSSSWRNWDGWNLKGSIFAGELNGL